MHLTNGKKDGIQNVTSSEVAVKDYFLDIKNVSRDNSAPRATKDDRSYTV